MAIVMANYPNRDGRLANGVGLDTPAGVCGRCTPLPRRGMTHRSPLHSAELMERVSAGATNPIQARSAEEALPFAECYQPFSKGCRRLYAGCDGSLGGRRTDPFFRRDGLFCCRLAIPGSARQCRDRDPAGARLPYRPTETYHDPDLVPPHGYLAFYAWLAAGSSTPMPSSISASTATSNGCPGKALALSADCFPEAVLGPLPHLYPFIVNDPGEGTQAKRRAAAVIVDHLTPPLTRAESYGPLRELERLVDEYYEAARGRSAPDRRAAAADPGTGARRRARRRLRHRARDDDPTWPCASSTPICAS